MSFYVDIQHFRNDHHPRLTVFQNKGVYTLFRLTLFMKCYQRALKIAFPTFSRGGRAPDPLETPVFGGPYLAFGVRATLQAVQTKSRQDPILVNSDTIQRKVLRDI